MATVRNSNGTFALRNVSNPTGVNQWTRRAEIEQLWLRLLEEVDEMGAAVSVEHAAGQPFEPG